MEQWEYKRVFGSMDHKKKTWMIGGRPLEFLEVLPNELGRDGWELVAMWEWNFFFKRRLEPGQEARGGAGDASAD